MNECISPFPSSSPPTSDILHSFRFPTNNYYLFWLHFTPLHLLFDLKRPMDASNEQQEASSLISFFFHFSSIFARISQNVILLNTWNMCRVSLRIVDWDKSHSSLLFSWFSPSHPITDSVDHFIWFWSALVSKFQSASILHRSIEIFPQFPPSWQIDRSLLSATQSHSLLRCALNSFSFPDDDLSSSAIREESSDVRRLDLCSLFLYLLIFPIF